MPMALDIMDFLLSIWAESPKSMSLRLVMSFSLVNKMFWNLMSRWITPSLWQYTSADRSCLRIKRRFSSLSLFFFRNLLKEHSQNLVSPAATLEP